MFFSFHTEVSFSIFHKQNLLSSHEYILEKQFMGNSFKLLIHTSRYPKTTTKQVLLLYYLTITLRELFSVPSVILRLNCKLCVELMVYKSDYFDDIMGITLNLFTPRKNCFRNYRLCSSFEVLAQVLCISIE